MKQEPACLLGNPWEVTRPQKMDGSKEWAKRCYFGQPQKTTKNREAGSFLAETQHTDEAERGAERGTQEHSIPSLCGPAAAGPMQQWTSQ